MRSGFFLIVSFVAVVTSAAFAQQPTVDELVAKNIQAKGGPDALHALQSLRLSGKLILQEGQIEARYVETRKSPDKVRTEASLQSMTAVQAYDGTEGWKIWPFSGRKDPEKLATDDLKPLIEDAEMGGPLLDWQAKGSAVEYLGTEDVEGTPAHKLKVVRKNGDVSFVYLDPNYFLEIRLVTQRMQHGAQVEEEVDLGDYEKVENVLIPFSVESGHKGDPDKQKEVIEKGEANVPVDDAIFHFPAGK